MRTKCLFPSGVCAPRSYFGAWLYVPENHGERRNSTRMCSRVLLLHKLPGGVESSTECSSTWPHIGHIIRFAIASSAEPNFTHCSGSCVVWFARCKTCNYYRRAMGAMMWCGKRLPPLVLRKAWEVLLWDITQRCGQLPRTKWCTVHYIVNRRACELWAGVMVMAVVARGEVQYTLFCCIVMSYMALIISFVTTFSLRQNNAWLCC